GQELFFTIEGHPAKSPKEQPLAGYRRVSADYFRAMEIPLRRGRWFTAGEVHRKSPVAIVDERLAEKYFLGENPVGKRILYDTKPYEIIGIVGNVLHYALFQEALLGVDYPSGAYPTVYTPDIESANPVSTLVIRATHSTVA